MDIDVEPPMKKRKYKSYKKGFRRKCNVIKLK